VCGRYSVSSDASPEEIADLFDVAVSDNALAGRYNVAPSQAAPVLRLGRDGNREIVMLRWGLVPPWAKDIKAGFSNINARAESIATKPAFRDAFAHRRCLVIATGFYEWQGEGKAKRPFNVHLSDSGLFGMAGVWERWKAPPGDWIETFAIITTSASAPIASIHDRMPVIVPPHSWTLWLDPDASPDRLSTLLRPEPAVVAYEVSTRVNSPKNDDAACLAPAAPAKPAEPSKQGVLF
jgi:putative SOS response-associated peptidase YedK